MPTIYAVTQGEYSDYCVQAIFSTRELAEKYIKDCSDPETGKQEHGEMGIEEYELDPPAPELVWVTEYTSYIRVSDGAVDNSKPWYNWSRRMTLAPAHIRGQWRLSSGYLDHKFMKDSLMEGTSYVSAEHAHKLAVEGRQAFLRDPGNRHGEEQ